MCKIGWGGPKQRRNEASLQPRRWPPAPARSGFLCFDCMRRFDRLRTSDPETIILTTQLEPDLRPSVLNVLVRQRPLRVGVRDSPLDEEQKRFWPSHLDEHTLSRPPLLKAKRSAEEKLVCISSPISWIRVRDSMASQNGRIWRSTLDILSEAGALAGEQSSRGNPPAWTGEERPQDLRIQQ